MTASERKIAAIRDYLTSQYDGITKMDAITAIKKFDRRAKAADVVKAYNSIEKFQ